jgi:hypothetical protein
MRKVNFNPGKSESAKKEPGNQTEDLEDREDQKPKESPPDLTPAEKLKENETVTDNWLF